MIYPSVSIIVIGRNEAKNLRTTFMAIKNMNYPADSYELVYVDTGSSDNSVEIAEMFTKKVRVEESDWPTAGLARNKGLEVASFPYVHFVDGDIAIDPDYLRHAVEFLECHAEIVAVTGYYTEQGDNAWNRLLSYRRKDGEYVDEGQVTNTSGGGTYRKAGLVSVGGYDERIKKGQETELGLRMQKRGYKIWKLNISQGKHNFDINSCWDMVKRSFVEGTSLGYMYALAKVETDNNFIKPYVRSCVKTISIQTFLLFTLVISIMSKNPLWYFLTVFLYYSRVVVSNAKARKPVDYIKYCLVIAAFSFFTFCGIISFTIKHLTFAVMGRNLVKPKAKIHSEDSLGINV